MVSASFVMTVSVICGVLNCAYMGYSLLAIIQGKEHAPNGFIFRFVYIVVAGMSLCGDIMLYTAIRSGKNSQQDNADGVPRNILNKMQMALYVKLFVIAMDFVTPPMHTYNCGQDRLCMRAKDPKKMQWQDYLKGDPPADDVFSAIFSILFSLARTTVTTIVKGVVLYSLHDFYEGVRQQGTMASHGLLDGDDLQKQGQPANVVQVVQVMPGAYPGGGGMMVGAPMATGGPQAMPAQDMQLAGQPSGAANPHGMLYVPHPPPR